MRYAGVALPQAREPAFALILFVTSCGALCAAARTMSTELLYVDITERIIGVYYEVLNELGFGFLEEVLQAAMVRALVAAGLEVRQRVPLRVWFRGEQVGLYFADIIVNGVVLVELKTGPAIEPRHEAQTINYLRATDLEVALILLFGPQARVRRLAYAAERKRRPVEGIPQANSTSNAVPPDFPVARRQQTDPPDPRPE